MNEKKRSLFNLIKFVYQKKSKPFDIQYVEQFNAIECFPQIISILFNKDIPNLKKIITSSNDDMRNFRAAIDFLKKHKVSVNISLKKYPRFEQIEQILIDAIRTVFLKMDVDEVFTKSKIILKSSNLGYEYNNANDMFSGKFLITLLKSLTDEELEIPETVNMKTDFKSLIEPIFERVKVPLVIRSDSFEYENPDRFLIQVQIIFSVFSKKIDNFDLDESPNQDDFCQTIAPHHFSRVNTLMTLSKPMSNDNKSNIIVSKSEPLFSDQDSFYYDNDDHLNVVNSLINDNSQKIEHLGYLFTGNAPKLYIIVSNIVGQNIIAHHDENNVDLILHVLGERFPERKSLFDKIIKNKKNDQKKCIRTLLECVFFEKEDEDNLTKRCQSIFHDYRIKFDDYNAFYKSKGILFLPLLQRVAFKKYSDINIISYYPPNNLSLTELHNYFNKLNIPFVLARNSFEKEYQEVIFKYQAKVIIDQFDEEYLEKIVENSKRDSIYDESTPLLKTINVIGSRKGIYFNSFKSVIDGCLLPYFIECLLDRKSVV